MGFGSCVSWRKRQTEHLTPGNLEKETPNLIPPRSAEHSPFPSSRTIDSHRNVNSQALPWMFFRALLGQTMGSQKEDNLSKPSPDHRKDWERKKNLAVYMQKTPGLSGLDSPSKSAPNRDTTPGGREKVLPKRRHIAGRG